MTTKQYLAALKRLGLTPAGKATLEALGISMSTAQRIAAGNQAVPKTVAIILALRLELARLSPRP